MRVLIPLLPLIFSEEIELSDSNFDKEIKKFPSSLVKFYAPWCGHCKSMAPAFASAAKKLRKDDIQLISVDCTENSDTCQKFSVNGYPTLKTFKNGKSVKDYEGGRDEQSIIDKMREISLPSFIEINTKDDLQDLRNSETIPVVVGYFKSSTGRGAIQFRQASEDFTGSVKFAIVYTDEGFDKEQVPAIKLFRNPRMKSKFEQEVIVYDDEKFSHAKIERFVTENRFGVAPLLDEKEQETYGYPQIVAVYDVDYVKNPKMSQFWRNRVMKTSLEFPEINFAISDTKKFINRFAATGLELNDPKKQGELGSPLVFAFDNAETYYVMEDEFLPDCKALKSFVGKFKAQELEKFVRSEKEPDQQKSNKKLTAKNLKQNIDNKPAFIKFYAPWCGHCTAMAPAWEELAEKYKDFDVVIGDYNAIDNTLAVPQEEIKDFELSGYPSIYWKAKDGKAEKYSGGRSFGELEDYLKKKLKASTKKLEKDLEDL